MSIQPLEYPNYGKNACAIISIQSTPPIICIANTNGTIYHALLLPVTDEEDLNEVNHRVQYYILINSFAL